MKPSNDNASPPEVDDAAEPGDRFDSLVPSFLCAGSFLLPGIRTEQTSRGWMRAGLWLVAWGLIIGIAYAAVFRVAWRWFGEFSFVRFVPMAVVLGFDLAWGGYVLVAALVTGVNRRATPVAAGLPGMIALVVLAVLKYAMLVSLPIGTVDWMNWRAKLHLLYPYPIYRPLILMPLWGRWAMMMAMCIGRLAPDASARLRTMAGHTRMTPILLYWLAIAMLTTLYSGASDDLARGIVIGMGVMLATYLASFVLSRVHDGQNEITVGIAGLIAELAFLTLYLPVVSDVFRY